MIASVSPTSSSVPVLMRCSTAAMARPGPQVGARRHAHAREQVPGRLVELATYHATFMWPMWSPVPLHHRALTGGREFGRAHGIYFVSLNSSRPISMRRISEVPAPIS